MKSQKFAAVSLILGALSVCLLAQDQPKAPVREVTDTYFGTKVVDPYRWMEDLKSPEMAAWMKAQSDYTSRYMDRAPLRGDFLKRLDALSNAGIAVSSLQLVGNRYFYLRVAPGENSPKLYVREGVNGAERVLFDPEKLATKDKHYSIGGFGVSQGGTYVSYALSEGGAENGELRVLETATGRDLADRIDRSRIDYGAWLPDGRSFLYNRLQKLAPGAPQTEVYKKDRVFVHVLGTDPDKDKVVLGYDTNPELRFDETMLVDAWPVPGSNYVIADVTTGVSPNGAFYIAPVSALSQSVVPWKKIAELSDEVADVQIHGDDIYILTYKQTPRYKVLRTSVSNPDLSKAQTVIPASEAVVRGIGAAGDALYVSSMDAGIGRLWRVDFKDGSRQQIPLPYDGAVSLSALDPRVPGVLVRTTSWTKSPTIYAYDPQRKSMTETRLQPPSSISFSGIESIETKAPAPDGTMIPLSIIYKRGVKRDGSSPALIEGYGAYGISREPTFTPASLALLERGVVMAVAHVRGGGEYGEDWHLAGFQQTKANTWKDFIACAEFLVREKYTSAAHLAAGGRSAGGILIANAIVERPDLFRAAIIQVGYINVLRAETTANGVPNIPEFGTFKTADGFKALVGMDAYNKIKGGTAYPAVLLTTGINDPRVEPWMSGKVAARLQAATSSGKPILLRVDYDAGHGVGITKQQANEETADRYAFLLQQLNQK
ncbi:MAG TPA: prolyl oligopeptidase family serine peptidase [Terriglobia bacterium]|nr:prolyl oligopeptidase family serine peptidase [Terriglobia bacterium]